jgi:hypothetical protein
MVTNHDSCREPPQDLRYISLTDGFPASGHQFQTFGKVLTGDLPVGRPVEHAVDRPAPEH